MIAANGAKIAEVGEKLMPMKTSSGETLNWPFIAGDVRNMLKSVGTTCDQGNWVVYTKDGGWIINEKTRKRTPFNRVQNTYAIDVWVETPEEEQNGWTTVKGKRQAASGFTRQSAVP